jgi:hypothetical protein
VQSLVECVLALPAATSGGRYRVHAAFCVRLNPGSGSSGSSGGAEDKCGEAASQPIRIDTVDRSSPTGAPTNQPLPPPPPSSADASALAWLLGPGLVLWVALLILLAVCCCRQRYFRHVLPVLVQKIPSKFLPFSFSCDYDLHFLRLLLVYIVSFSPGERGLLHLPLVLLSRRSRLSARFGPRFQSAVAFAR